MLSTSVPLCHFLQALALSAVSLGVELDIDHEPGHSNLWADGLSSILKEEGFELVENWSSLYAKSTPKGPIIIDVYVADLIMYGPKGAGGLRDHIDRVRRKVKMEEPHPVARYLGVHHAFRTAGQPGQRVTNVEYNMSNYFGTKVRKYKQDTSATLRKVDAPHVPKTDNQTFEKKDTGYTHREAVRVPSHGTALRSQNGAPGFVYGHWSSQPIYHQMER